MVSVTFAYIYIYKYSKWSFISKTNFDSAPDNIFHDMIDADMRSFSLEAMLEELLRDDC